MDSVVSHVWLEIFSIKREAHFISILMSVTMVEDDNMYFCENKLTKRKEEVIVDYHDYGTMFLVNKNIAWFEDVMPTGTQIISCTSFHKALWVFTIVL